MPYYRRVGDVPAKRHVIVEQAGSVLAEELMGLEGFSSDSALLYRRHSPGALVDIQAVPSPRDSAAADAPLMPRHMNTSKLAGGGDPVTGRQLLLANDDIEVSWVDERDTSPLYRNALGDELTYVQSGGARVETSFGAIKIGPGDYLCVPTATTQRWQPGSDGIRALAMSARGRVSIPDRYRSGTGQILEGAPFCERDLRAPSEPLVVDDTNVPVLVRNVGGWTELVHEHHPFDVVGWDGCLYPYALSIHDFEPLVGAIHQPPPVHQTFGGNGFVVCSFVPRPFDFWPGAIKVPYHHSNVDSDEVIFYSAGDFMSRKGAGIGVGSLSFHPAGFVHGPQPGSLESARSADRTEEVAVMIDTFRPLQFTETARSITDEQYPWTWSGGRHESEDPQ